jgi:hypothetical protein
MVKLFVWRCEMNIKNPIALTLGGYTKFIVDKTVGLKIFELLASNEVYELDTRWEEQETIPFVTPVNIDKFQINVVQMTYLLWGLQAQADKEAKAREGKAKG